MRYRLLALLRCIKVFMPDAFMYALKCYVTAFLLATKAKMGSEADRADGW
jgi:hypothetical protein